MGGLCPLLRMGIALNALLGFPALTQNLFYCYPWPRAFALRNLVYPMETLPLRSPMPPRTRRFQAHARRAPLGLATAAHFESWSWCCTWDAPWCQTGSHQSARATKYEVGLHIFGFIFCSNWKSIWKPPNCMRKCWTQIQFPLLKKVFPSVITALFLGNMKLGDYQVIQGNWTTKQTEQNLYDTRSMSTLACLTFFT